MLSVLSEEMCDFVNFPRVPAVFLGGFGRAMAAGVAGGAVEGAG